MLDVTWLRITVVVTAVVTACGVGAVMRLHWRAFRRLPATAALTPLHVALVSAGVLQLDIALAWAQLASLRNPTTWDGISRMVQYCTGNLTILIALAVIGGLQRRKVRIAAPATRVIVEEVEQVSVADVASTPPDEGRAGGAGTGGR